MQSGLWLWHAGVSAPNAWMRFRRSVHIDRAPNRAICRIAVDSKYWLWINGQLVVREGGLKRGPTPTGTYADVIDLAPYLRPGDNSIAVLVWYWGAGGSSHNSSGQGGFWLDCPELSLHTDRLWRVDPHPAFMASEPKLFNGQQIVPEWSVHYDASKAATWDDFARENFDDSAWAFAAELGRPPQQPWGELYDRPVPFWRDSDITPYPRQEETTSPEGATIRAYLPTNMQVYPRFDITAAAGQVVQVQIERDWKTTTYHTRAGRQEFEVPAWGNGHWVEYKLPAGAQLHSLSFRQTGYDSDMAGQFQCDDEALNILWQKSARSTYLNSRDNFSDCPDRERSQWPADASYIAAQAYYALDRRVDLLARKFLREFFAWRTPEGILWGAVPTGRFTPSRFREFPGQSLVTIALGLRDYFLHTGDSETAAQACPLAAEYLLKHFKMGSDGLVEHRGPDKIAWGPGTQVWFDWDENQDWPALENVLYLMAMEATVELSEQLPTTVGANAAELRGRIASIRGHFRPKFWTGAAFSSPDRDDKAPDDRVNSLAVLAGLSEPSDAPSLVATLMTQRHASIAMERFALEALCLLGRTDLAIERMKQRYANEITSSYSTLPEGWGGQANHGWGGGPLVVLARHILGLTPVEPGWKRWRLRPQLAHLTALKANIALPQGPASLKIERQGDRCAIEVTSPPLGKAGESGGILELTGPLAPAGEKLSIALPPGHFRHIVRGN